jgi:hypothetical protein
MARKRKRTTLDRYHGPSAGSAVLFALLSLVCCAPLFGIVAWRIGGLGWKASQEHDISLESAGKYYAARLIGMVSTVLSLGGLALWAASVSLGFGLLELQQQAKEVPLLQQWLPDSAPVKPAPPR